MEIFLVRHGQSEYNIGLTEDLDSPLTPLGVMQAERTALRMADEGLTQIYVSPLRRTLQTAGPICAAAHLQAEVYPEVCEFFSPTSPDYARFPGLTPEQMTEEYPWVTIGESFPCEFPWWPQQLESSDRLVRRAERARDALLRLHGATNHRILVLSHADPLGRLMEAFLRVEQYPDDPPWLENCSVSQLHCGPDLALPAELRCVNDVSHLAGLLP